MIGCSLILLGNFGIYMVKSLLLVYLSMLIYGFGVGVNVIQLN